LFGNYKFVSLLWAILGCGKYYFFSMCIVVFFFQGSNSIVPIVYGQKRKLKKCTNS